MKRVLVATCLVAFALNAQTTSARSPSDVNGGSNGAPPCPSEFADLCSYMQSRLTEFDSYISKHWDGKRNPDLVVGAEFYPMDAYFNISPQYYSKVGSRYLEALKKLGVRATKVKVDFPMLVPDWYVYKYNYRSDQFDCSVSANKNNQYCQRLATYRQMVSDVIAAGITLDIQTIVSPAAGGSTTDPMGLAGFYAKLDQKSYTEGRVKQVLAVAQLLSEARCPKCYITFSAEPTNEGAKATQRWLVKRDPNFVRNSIALVTAISQALDRANIPGLHKSILTSIGVETFAAPIPVFEELLSGYTKVPGIDVFEMHIHPINRLPNGLDFLMRAVTIADAAKSAGKGCKMNEQWPYYVRNNELGVVRAPEIEARSPFSFWTPMDKQFMTALWKFVNWKGCDFLSFSYPQVFFARLDYDNIPGCKPASSCGPREWQKAEGREVGDVITGSFKTTEAGRALTSLGK